MPIEAAPFELAWLQELERRVAAGQSIDPREMMVRLRDSLPRGFQPSMINQRFLYNRGPSVEGLLAAGDGQRLVPDVERAIHHVRELLIRHPELARVTAEEIGTALRIATERAERVLALVGSLGAFYSGASSSLHGFSAVSLERDDVLAEYLAFDTLEGFLARREAERQGRSVGRVDIVGHASEVRIEPTAAAPNTVFVLMSMNRGDDSLDDVLDAIKTECARFKLTAIRVDDIEHQDIITEKIIENIESAAFIVADLSGERPNVYYEVGYAHAIGKHPILIRKGETKIHFDLAAYSVLSYDNIRGLRALLRRRLEAMTGRAPREEAQ